MQPSPKWPYVMPAQPLVAEQRPELAEVRGEALRRHDPVLEARPRRRAVREAGRASRAVLADPPQDPLGGRDPRAGRRPGHPRRVPAAAARRAAWSRSSAGGLAAGLDQQPRAARGQQARIPPAGEQVRGQALDGEGPLGQQARDGRRGGDVVGEGEDQQAAQGRRPDEPERGLGDHGAGPLAADERPGDVPAALREQPVQGVAGDPAGPRRAAPGGSCRRGSRPPRRGAHRAPARAPPSAAARPVCGDDLHPQRVLGRGPPPDRPRTAGVVAEHPADRAPAVRGWVGPDPQPVRGGGPVEVVEDRARQHRRGPRLRVQRQDAREMPRQVHHEPGPDRVAGDAGPCAAHRERHAGLGGPGHDLRQVVPVPRRHDGRRAAPGSSTRPSCTARGCRRRRPPTRARIAGGARGAPGRRRPSGRDWRGRRDRRGR